MTDAETADAGAGGGTDGSGGAIKVEGTLRSSGDPVRR